MKFFSGFSLQDEKELFTQYLLNSDFCVSGFSQGAIEAFEFVYTHPKSRVDRVILISPAFFQNKKNSYKRLQLHHYKLNPTLYIQNFLTNVAYPSDFNLKSYYKEGAFEQLDTLLHYEWQKEKIKEVLARGVIIEVFIGKSDKIVDSQESFDFFSKLVPVYLFKDKGHLLM